MKKQINFLTVSLFLVVFFTLGFHKSNQFNTVSSNLDTCDETSIAKVDKVETNSFIKKTKRFYKKDKVKAESSVEQSQEMQSSLSLFELANQLEVKIGNFEEPVENTEFKESQSSVVSLSELIGLYGIKSF